MRASRNPTASHIFGIDYGQSKVGLAIADSETRIAFGFGTLKNDKDLLPKLAEIAKKEKISKIIIGTSSESQAVREKFGDILKEKLKVEVEYQDEMFTTLQAQRNIKEKGLKGVQRFDDREAARLILEGWLDKKRKV